MSFSVARQHSVVPTIYLEFFSFPPPDLNTEKLAANLQSTCGDPDAYVTTLHFCSIGSSCLLLICLSGRWHLAVLCVHMCAIYSAFPSVITRPFHNPRSGQIGVDVQREDAECRIPITKDPVNWIAGQQHPLDKTEGNRQGRKQTDDKEKQRRTIHRRLIRGV